MTNYQKKKEKKLKKRLEISIKKAQNWAKYTQKKVSKS